LDAKASAEAKSSADAGVRLSAGSATQRRESLSSAERLKLTHPSSVWRRWSAEFGD
jgi:hypothetical protein